MQRLPALTRSRVIRGLFVPAMALVLAGCASLNYYSHVARGQLSLLLHRRPIERVVSDPHTPNALAARLRLAREARQFASTALGLPKNRSYTTYVQLHREFVVWNVFATPRFSVDAIPQCFPIAGCVAYRGYFSKSRAEAAAEQLKAGGDDVWVGGVPAYSTLGWFADPILSSMLRWDDDELAATIFHELAHQLIYLKDDTAFNESFATFVQREGLREWCAARELPPPDERERTMREQFTHRVLDLRTQLADLYRVGGDAEALAAGKKQRIDAFRQRYRQWRADQWPDQHGYDTWVAAPINNARLLPFGLYDRYEPAFSALFRQLKRSWPAFYNAVRALAAMPKAQRDQRLDQLLQDTSTVR